MTVPWYFSPRNAYAIISVQVDGHDQIIKLEVRLEPN